MARLTTSSNRKRRTFRYESLEERTLMAGDVGVNIVNGSLNITGDANANDVVVVQQMNRGVPIAGSFYVAGVNGTTINGSASGRYFNGVTQDLNVNLGGGSDHLTLGNDTSSSNFKLPNNLSIHMGSGNDTVDVKGITVAKHTAIDTGSGNDTLDIRGNFGTGGDTSANDLVIDTEGGSDTVRVHNTFVRHDLQIDTRVTLKNRDYTYKGYLPGDKSSDVVDLAFMNIGHNVVIHTDSELGRDRVSVDNVGVNGGLTILTYQGDDYVSIRDSEVDFLFADLGYGNDKFYMANSFGSQASVHGGDDGGFDAISGHDNSFTEAFRLYGFESNGLY